MCLLLAVTALGGCNFLREEKPIEEEMDAILKQVDFNAGTDYKGKLKIAVMKDDASLTSINAFINDFKAVYTGINVELVQYESYTSDLSNMHSTAFATNDFSSMPDVFWLANEDIPAMYAKDMVMPLNYFVDADNNFTTDNLVQSMVQDSYYAGNMYMMPRDYNQFVMFYNTRIFEQAKAENPEIKSPAEFVDENGDIRAMNHDEFDRLARQMAEWFRTTDAKNIRGNAYGSSARAVEARLGWGSLNYALAKTFGATFVDETGVTFNNDASVEFMAYMRDLIYNDVMTLDSATGFTYFITERSAMCFESRACMSDVIKSSTAAQGVYEYLGAAPMPNLGHDDKYAVGAGCSGYAMYRYSDDLTPAWLFLKHIVSETAQNAFSAIGNGIPVLSSLLTDPTASWRAIKTENSAKFGKLPADFSHDSFVYGMEYATTIDFKKFVPDSVVTEVCEDVNGGIVSVATSAVIDSNPEKTKANIKKMLTIYANSIRAKIAAGEAA